jgi:pimeloyl-ACP methyl ester carboxylesterase
MERSMHENDEQLSQHVCTFDLPGGKVSAILTSGPGQKVLLLHGNSSCKEVFAHVIPHLMNAGHSILAPDFPGHGDSSDAENPEETYCFGGYANVVNDLLQAVGWTNFISVGWSLGGHVALELVSKRPDCTALMLIGSPPGKPSVEALQEAFFASEGTLLAGKSEFTEQDAVNYAGQMLGEFPPDPFLLERVRRTDGRARALMFHSALSGKGIDQRDIVLDRYRPVAIVHGADEPFVRQDYLERLTYGRLWGSKLVVLPGIGHAPHWQCPLIFNEILKEFLSKPHII